MEAAELKSGDVVQIKQGRYQGRLGTIESIVRKDVGEAILEIVWVRFPDGIVDGYSPRVIEKVSDQVML